jgi:hypothetical protein
MKKAKFKETKSHSRFNSNEKKGLNGSHQHFKYFNIALMFATILHIG